MVIALFPFQFLPGTASRSKQLDNKNHGIINNIFSFARLNDYVGTYYPYHWAIASILHIKGQIVQCSKYVANNTPLAVYV